MKGVGIIAAIEYVLRLGGWTLDAKVVERYLADLLAAEDVRSALSEEPPW